MATLTKQQAAKVRASIDPAVHYLYRLVRRMEEVGFAPDDPLYVAAREAWQAVVRLSGRLGCVAAGIDHRA